MKTAEGEGGCSLRFLFWKSHNKCKTHTFKRFAELGLKSEFFILFTKESFLSIYKKM